MITVEASPLCIVDWSRHRHVVVSLVAPCQLLRAAAVPITPSAWVLLVVADIREFPSALVASIRVHCRTSLTLTLLGGQWPQSRLAATKRWTDDSRCQLCEGAGGNLSRRRLWLRQTPALGADSAWCRGVGVTHRLSFGRPPPGSYHRLHWQPPYPT